MSTLRSYGLGNSKTTGTPPEWVPIEDSAAVCSNPDCKGRVVEVRVRVKDHPIMREECWGYYLGCPACQYASPMLSVRDGTPLAETRAADWEKAKQRVRRQAAAEKLLAACRQARAVLEVHDLGATETLRRLNEAIEEAGG